MKRLLALFALCGATAAFHYTCDQLIYELLESGKQLPTKYACVVFEYPITVLDMPYYDAVFLRDNSNGARYSLREVHGSCNYCVEGKGPWEVVTDGSFPVICNTELVLLFSSQESLITSLNYPTPFHSDCPIVNDARYAHSLDTRVALNFAAIDLNFGHPEESSHIGIGSGEEEEMYFIGSGESNVVVMNWVVSTSHATVGTSAVFTPVPVVNLQLEKSPVLASSALNGNANWRKEMVASTVTRRNDEDPTVRVTGFVEYATSNFLSLVAEDAQIDIVESGSVDITMFSNFKIVYNTHPQSFSSGRFNESFELKFALIGDASPTQPSTSNYALTTEASVTELLRSTEPSSVTEPSQDEESKVYCSCGVDEDGIALEWASQIWLDIVILIDTSRSMGVDGLDEVSEVVESFLGLMNLDYNGPSELFSRVGLIALSSKTEVVYNLNMTSASEVNLSPSKALFVDISAGFQAAMKMLQEGRRMSNYRRSAKQVIYFITNSDPQGNLNGVHEFKASGGTIIVANYVREGQVGLEGLRALASPHYFFTNLTSDYTYNLQVLCDANCYCPPDLHAFTDPSINPRQEANRGCFHVANSGIPFKNALKTCTKENSSIATIHDAETQFFLTSIVSTFGPKTKYWIGLQNNGTDWEWTDKSMSPFTNWEVAQPDTEGGKYACAYAVQTVGFTSKWFAANCNAGYYFVCERAPCEAGNYCTFDGN